MAPRRRSLGPDFRRDDGGGRDDGKDRDGGKGRDDGTKNNNNEEEVGLGPDASNTRHAVAKRYPEREGANSAAT